MFDIILQVEAKEREKENINSSICDVKQNNTNSTQSKIEEKIMALPSKEDAYVFKEEEDNDFEPNFRSLKSGRRKSHTLKETQYSTDRRRAKRTGQVHNEEKLVVEGKQPTVEEKQPEVEERRTMIEEKRMPVEEMVTAVIEKRTALEEKRALLEEKQTSLGKTLVEDNRIALEEKQSKLKEKRTAVEEKHMTVEKKTAVEEKQMEVEKKSVIEKVQVTAGEQQSTKKGKSVD